MFEIISVYSVLTVTSQQKPHPNNSHFYDTQRCIFLYI